MKHNEFLKPTIGKILLTFLMILILPNFAYWSCGGLLHGSEYKIHFGAEALLLQTGILVPRCGPLTYLYFWPLSILIVYPISCLVISRLSKRVVFLVGSLVIILSLIIAVWLPLLRFS